MNNVYEIIVIALYFVIVIDTIRRHGIFSLPSLFYLSLGFFQVNRIILDQFPSVQSLFGNIDYSFEAILLIISISSFKLAYEIGIRLIPSKRLEFQITPHKRLAGLGSLIIKITFPVCAFLTIRTLLSPALGRYGIDNVGPSVYEKSALYGALIGLQFINSSAFPLTRKTTRLFFQVFIPRLVLGFFTMRSLFSFFIAAQLNIWYVIGIIKRKNLRKIAWFLVLSTPVIVIASNVIRFFRVLDQFDVLSLTLNPLVFYYVAAAPITLTQIAVDNLKSIPDLFYSLSTVIAIYLPFLASSDYYLDSEEGIVLNRLDRSLTIFLFRDRGIEYAGTGGNYIADLFIDGGFWGVAIGSCFLGLVTALFVIKMRESRLFIFLALHFSQKLIYSPRGTFTEIFDMLPIYAAIFFAGKFLSNYLFKSKDHLGKSLITQPEYPQ